MKGDETIKQIMKRGLKLFLILCLLVESFSTAVAVKAEETADKGHTVKIYVDNTVIESKWYNYGERIQLPKYYEKAVIEEGTGEDGEKIYWTDKEVSFIHEWKWIVNVEYQTAVDQTPELILTPDFTLESDVIKIRGYTGYTASTKDDDKKITVRFHINKSCTEERIYEPGTKVMFPDCYQGKWIEKWQYALNKNSTWSPSWSQKDTDQVKTVYGIPDIMLTKDRTVWNFYGYTKGYVSGIKLEPLLPESKEIVIIDTTPPVIKNIKNKKKYKKNKVTVYASDDNELFKVTVNGKKVKLKKTKTGKYKGYYQFTLKRKKKTKKYKIIAWDPWDNHTTKTIWICKKK